MWAIRTDHRGRGPKKFRLLIGCIQMNTDQELMALQTRDSDLLRNVIRRSKTVVHGKVILCGSHSHFNPKPASTTSRERSSEIKEKRLQTPSVENPFAQMGVSP